MPQHVWRKLLCLTGVSLFASLTVPVLAQNQNPPASTYQPGYWQPIARVNPNSPVTVILVNKTDSPLKYNLLDGRNEKDLAVGVDTQLKNVALPVNIAVYDPSPQAGAGQDAGLKYETSVKNNVLNVTIMPAETSNSRVLNIAKSGAIYLY